MHLALNFDVSLDDLDLHSRAQLYEKSKSSMSILLEMFGDLDEILFITVTCCFVEAHVKLFCTIFKG